MTRRTGSDSSGRTRLADGCIPTPTGFEGVLTMEYIALTRIFRLPD